MAVPGQILGQQGRDPGLPPSHLSMNSSAEMMGIPHFLAFRALLDEVATSAAMRTSQHLFEKVRTGLKPASSAILSSSSLFAVPVKQTQLPSGILLTVGTDVISGMLASWTSNWLAIRRTSSCSAALMTPSRWTAEMKQSR